MESVACPLCTISSGDATLVQPAISFDHDQEMTFTLLRCKACGLIFLSPRPTREEIAAYYPAEYYPVSEPRPRQSRDRLPKQIARALKQGIREEFYGYPVATRNGGFGLLRRLLLYPKYWHLRFIGHDIIPFSGEGRILDVGCGPGWLLRELRTVGWDTYGVDFSAVAIEHARNNGLKVKQGDLLDVAYQDEFFDAVVFSHSLEHLYNPVETLREVRRILKRRGLLIIIIPNAGSFEARLFGKSWESWDVPRHLYHFNKTTMRLLLERTSFRPLQIGDGLSRSSFLGSVDRVHKKVLGTHKKHGFLMRSFATWFCRVSGHLGYGSEIRVLAEKP